MSKFFKRGIFYKTVAVERYNIMKTGIDEEENMALSCYYLQLSLEFFLKGTLEYFCDEEVYLKKMGHKLIQPLKKITDIKDNVKNFDVLSKVFEKLEPYCNEVSLWNEETRYNFNFVTTLNLINSVFSIISDYEKWIKDTIPEVTCD